MVSKSQNAETPPGSGKGLKPRLIAMARCLLERDGLEALTLRAAAREAHVSHMAPYRHFKDKDDLLAAVAEEGFRELAAYMDTMAASGDPRGSGVAYVNFALDNPALYRLMFGAGLPSPARFPGLFAAGAEAFQHSLPTSGTDAPDDSSRETPAAAIARWSIVHGLASLAIDGRVTLPPKGPQRDARIAAILQLPG
jgi:AcrR family transcriptional regulator